MVGNPRLRNLIEKVGEAFQALIDAAVEECIKEWCKAAKAKNLKPVFTTADIERCLAERYPELWQLLTSIYPLGGGRRYTVRSHLARTLNRLASSEKGLKRGLRRPPPPDWTAPDIAEYECIDP